MCTFATDDLVTHTIKIRLTYSSKCSPHSGVSVAGLTVVVTTSFTIPSFCHDSRFLCFTWWELWYLKGRIPRRQNGSLLPGRGWGGGKGSSEKEGGQEVEVTMMDEEIDKMARE